MGRMQTAGRLCVAGMAMAIVLGPWGAAALAQDDVVPTSLGGGWLTTFPGPNDVNGVVEANDVVYYSFDFAPLDPMDDAYALVIHGSDRPPEVLKAFPEVDEFTEHVGRAVRTEPNMIEFTTLGYGLDRQEGVDEIVYISLISGTIHVTPEPLNGDKAPGDDQGALILPFFKLRMDACVSYYVTAQDADRDGFPDTCNEVICKCYTTVLKRVEVQEPCVESESFVAHLAPMEGVTDPNASGRFFMKMFDDATQAFFVLNVDDVNDATAAHIHVADAPDQLGPPVVTLFPIPPEEAPRLGRFAGLLSNGTFSAADFMGPLAGMTMQDLLTAVREDRASVRVHTEDDPDGLIRGLIQDP